ncbi:hypothetical protein [uncultured Jannaschia sp.]|uniref:hypothetical protein n=1 Tax=uncultured Jannaschia sp. TaxID=293347 RepID=UPI0026332B71|nr:hypothetical protein [uncultured Jannaschia sp.]
MSHHLLDARALHRRARTADAFGDWLRDDPDALVDAADLLGGPDWARRAAGVADALAAGACVLSLLPDLEALRCLLTLELTDDPWSEEAARFLSVHPDDPRADGARLCAEVLERGLAALKALAAADPAQRPEAA